MNTMTTSGTAAEGRPACGSKRRYARRNALPPATERRDAAEMLRQEVTVMASMIASATRQRVAAQRGTRAA